MPQDERTRPTNGTAAHEHLGADRQGWVARRDPVLWGIFAVYLALAITSSYVHELGYGPDEISRHLPYVEWLAEERCLPPDDPEAQCAALELHPPGYYIVMVPAYLAARPYGRRTVLRVLRWTSPFLILGVLLLWFGVVRAACADDRRTSLFAFALTAWWPNLFVDAATFNNDAGALLVAAGVAYLLSVKQFEARTDASAALWGALAGLGGLVKTSVPVAVIPMIALCLAWQHGKRFWADARFWRRALLAAAAFLATCGWWFLRNLVLHGSFSGVTTDLGYCLIPQGLTKIEALMAGLVAPLLLRAINGLWVSVFAGAVWFPDWSHATVYGILRIVTALGIIGTGVGLYRLRSGRAHLAPGQAPAIVLPAAGFAALYLSDIWVSIFVHAGFYQGGRYLLMLLPGLTVPLALGIKLLCPRPLRTIVMILLACFFLALNFLVWYHLITYWNPYVLSTAGRFE